MDREGLAHALAVDRGRQDRIVGRVIDGVGDAEARNRSGEPVSRQRGCDADRNAAEDQAAREHDACPMRSTMKPAGVCNNADDIVGGERGAISV